VARFRLTVEYDGGPFQGWQRQDHAPTVQGTLQQAGARLNGGPVTVYGSGRTDSGVHALAQIAHVDFDKPLRADQVRDALNFHLKEAPISVLAAAASRPSVTGSVRRSLRSKRWTMRGFCGPARKSTSSLRRGVSCTNKCAALSAVWSKSAWTSGTRKTCKRRWTRVTAGNADPLRRRTACIW